MPTYRVTYLVVPGCRRLMEDVEADALRREATTVVLLRDVLVVNRPRQVVALRVLRREVRQVEPHCPGGAVPQLVADRADDALPA